jgi:hypothetical protein
LGLALLVTAAPAAAQANVAVDLAIGYSFLKPDDRETLPLGWNFSLAVKPLEHVHVIVDVGGHYMGSGDLWFLHTFTGGLRVREPHVAQFVPFVQATLGPATGLDDGDVESSWVFQPGGGIDIPFRPDYLRPNGPAFRAQVDFPYYFGNGRSTWGTRFSAGVVIPIK